VPAVESVGRVEAGSRERIMKPTFVMAGLVPAIHVFKSK
jgi:hypothetical protein